MCVVLSECVHFNRGVIESLESVLTSIDSLYEKETFFALWSKYLSDNWNKNGVRFFNYTDGPNGFKLYFEYEVYTSINNQHSSNNKMYPDNVLIVKSVEFARIN
jgi:hypothetical protein